MKLSASMSKAIAARILQPKRHQELLSRSRTILTDNLAPIDESPRQT
jgi:hypothetical protein